MMLILTGVKSAQSCQSLAQIGWNDQESHASGALVKPVKTWDASSCYMKPILKHPEEYNVLYPLQGPNCWQ